MKVSTTIKKIFPALLFSIVLLTGIILLMSGRSSKENTDIMTDQAIKTIKLITLDPGHFHAALVQKSMYSEIDPEVHVYAPDGPDLKAHLALIDSYNTRADDHTSWVEKLYTGEDFMDKMISDKSGNVVVIAGNNKSKTQYIKRSVDAGFNVLADKPMAINSADFAILQNAFVNAEKKGVLLYDIMTERYDITNILQKEFAHLPEVFGDLEKGTDDKPSVITESVHYFSKMVSGRPLIRPSWFLDVAQQGDGIVDVMTHLVDLAQWKCFPETVLDYRKDIYMRSAKRWPTPMTLKQFSKITELKQYPGFLEKDVKDGVLNVFANGEMNYTLKGIHTRLSVIWNFEAPEGTGDTHFTAMHGTKASLVIRQGKEEKYLPTLYIEPSEKSSLEAFRSALQDNLKKIQAKYPGVELRATALGYEVVIPSIYKIGHEAAFAEVTKKYLQYLKAGKLPEWEVPNMIAKYYTTTQALAKAMKK